MDGDNLVTAINEGLVLARSMPGFTSAAATANTGINQTLWDATRANLNAHCGTSLPQGGVFTSSPRHATRGEKACARPKFGAVARLSNLRAFFVGAVPQCVK